MNSEDVKSSFDQVYQAFRALEVKCAERNQREAAHDEERQQAMRQELDNLRGLVALHERHTEEIQARADASVLTRMREVNVAVATVRIGFEFAIKQTEEALLRSRADIAKLKEDNKALQANKDYVDRASGRLRARDEKEEARLVEPFHAQIRVLRASQSAADKKVAELHSLLAAEKQRVLAQQAIKEAEMDANASLKTRIETLERQLEELPSGARAADIEDIKRLYEIKLEQEKAQLIEVTRNMSARLKEQVDRQRGQIDTLKATATQAQTENRTTARELDEAKKQMQAKDREIQKLIRQNEATARRLAECEREAENVMQRFSTSNSYAIALARRLINLGVYSAPMAGNKTLEFTPNNIEGLNHLPGVVFRDRAREQDDDFETSFVDKAGYFAHIEDVYESITNQMKHAILQLQLLSDSTDKMVEMLARELVRHGITSFTIPNSEIIVRILRNAPDVVSDDAITIVLPREDSMDIENAHSVQNQMSRTQELTEANWNLTVENGNLKAQLQAMRQEVARLEAREAEEGGPAARGPRRP